MWKSWEKKCLDAEENLNYPKCDHLEISVHFFNIFYSAHVFIYLKVSITSLEHYNKHSPKQRTSLL